jgi:hypothetical protein
MKQHWNDDGITRLAPRWANSLCGMAFCTLLLLSTTVAAQADEAARERCYG